MSTNRLLSEPVASPALRTSPETGVWMIRRAGHSEPLAQRLGSVVSAYQRRAAGLGLFQGCMPVQAASPEAAAAAAEECARVLARLPAPWSAIRLGGPPRDAAAPAVLANLPASAVLAASRAAGLLPPSRLDRAMPGLHLALWIMLTLGAITLLAIGGSPSGPFSPGWRLTYAILAIVMPAGVLHWAQGRREKRLSRRCSDAFRRGPSPAQQQAFAQALAAPALVALPKPVAIIIEAPGQLDALSLDILRRMWHCRDAATIGVVHWIVLMQPGQDEAAAAAVLAAGGGPDATVLPEPTCVLTWHPAASGRVS